MLQPVQLTLHCTLYTVLCTVLYCTVLYCTAACTAYTALYTVLCTVLYCTAACTAYTALYTVICTVLYCAAACTAALYTVMCMLQYSIQFTVQGTVHSVEQQLAYLAQRGRSRFEVTVRSRDIVATEELRISLFSVSQICWDWSLYLKCSYFVFLITLLCLIV